MACFGTRFKQSPDAGSSDGMFYGGLGGIDQKDGSVAYKEVLIAPQMVNGADSVSTNFKTPYGTVVSKWTKLADGEIVEVDIPVNASAILVLPAKEESEILENGVSILNYPDVKIISREADKTTIRLGSGLYKIKISISIIAD